MVAPRVWRPPRANRSRTWWLPVALVAVAQAVLVLGPALGAGLVIVYDMAWAPDPRWTPFVLGLDTPAPRAVPSDAVAVALGQVLGASTTQKLVLLSILTTLGVGSAALLSELMPSAGHLSRVAATVFSVWNPYVYERLAVGQWTVLLGLSLLPWALREAARVGLDGRGAGPLTVVVVVAGLGGANSLVIVAVSVIPVMLFRTLTGGGARVAWTGAGVLLVTLGVSAAWSVPALLAGGVASTEDGALAFVPAADTPLGVVGSLMSGGGFWNATSHPDSRQVVLIAVVSAALAGLSVVAALHRAATTGRWPLAIGVLVPTALVVISGMPGLRSVWVPLVTNVPGGGILRDSHKLMAAWVVTMAVGLGVVVALAREHVRPSLRVPVSVLLLGLPVVLLPVLAWGLGGRLGAVAVPQEYRQSIERLNALPPGDVGLLPWNQYRRYDWNEDRVSLTLAPRLVTHLVLFDDALPLRSGVIPGESARAAAVTRNLDAGDDVRTAFSRARVRYVALERTRASQEEEESVLRAGRVVIDEPSLLVVEVTRAAAPHRPTPGPVIVGWSVTIGIVLITGVAGITRCVSRRT